MTIFYAESFAPWCEKARWALDQNGVAYREREHVPLIGEPTLRLAARRWSGPVTVPLLVDGDTVLMGSVAIAQRAEAQGRGAPLFPAVHVAEIASWDARSEIVMTSGRALLLLRMAGDPDALREQLPPFVPGALRGALRPIASIGVAHLVRKYGIHADPQHEVRIREALAELRAALADRDHLVGDAFSFADLTMATSLQFLLPVDDRYIALGPATRAVWTHPELAQEHADLLAWRDRLYASHRAAAQ